MPTVISGSGITSTGPLSTNGVNYGPRAIQSNALPVGSILQVVQKVKTNVWGTSSTTPVDVTDMTATITPQSASNKILVLIDAKITIYGHGDLYLLRNGTKICYGDAYGSQSQAAIHLYGSGSYGSAYDLGYGNVSFLDSPGSTSPVVYKLQGAVPHSSSYVLALNYCYPNENGAYNSRMASTLTLMEIAA